MNKMWEGRFESKTNKLTEKFNNSLSFDYKLLPFDIKASKVHVNALTKAKILNLEEQNKIHNGLDNILKSYECNKIDFNQNDEDIHMLIERLLTKDIGDIGKKVHTGRSRNDQVATATRLYTIDQLEKIKNLLNIWLNTLKTLTQKYKKNIMPGTTHLQFAQPITLGFWFDSYYEMFLRDLDRLNDCYKRINICPLGSGALSGTSYNLDRFYIAKHLNFSSPCKNAQDGVSDRDYIIELLSILSIIGIHLSKISEEIILFNSPFCNYINLSDEFSTGSSIMPQKKNPDVAELTRGKSARLIGNLVQILSLIKNTPLAYNKDFQEDKEHLFDSIDTIKICLEIFNEMILTSNFNLEKMFDDCQKGFLNATDLADYLVLKHIPFRKAHNIVGKLVLYAESNNIKLDDISLDVYKKYNNLIDKDVYEFINITNCVKRKLTYGGVGSLYNS